MLEIEMEKYYHCASIRRSPGMSKKGTNKHISKIPSCPSQYMIQKIPLCRIAYLLKQVLSM